MKAFVSTGDKQSMITLAEVPDPVPARDEAIIAVEAYSVNRGETLLLATDVFGTRGAGWRPGKDVAGRVIAPAADGSGPLVGTRVVAHPPFGGWAEHVAVSTRQIAALPDAIESSTAAALPLAGLTALRLMRVAGPLMSRRILLTGASGGVGHYFVELAAAAGADVTVVTASAERGERLLAIGAQRMIHDVAQADGPFDLVLESVGGTSLTAALAKLRPGGTLIWFGQASLAPASIDFFRFWEGPVSGTIRHFDYTLSDVSDGTDLATLVRLVAAGHLHPEIGLRADWQETPQVLQTLRNRGIRGNAVLTLNASALS